MCFDLYRRFSEYRNKIGKDGQTLWHDRTESSTRIVTEIFLGGVEGKVFNALALLRAMTLTFLVKYSATYKCNTIQNAFLRKKRGAKYLLTSVIQIDGILEASIEICSAFSILLWLPIHYLADSMVMFFPVNNHTGR